MCSFELSQILCIQLSWKDDCMSEIQRPLYSYSTDTKPSVQQTTKFSETFLVYCFSICSKLIEESLHNMSLKFSFQLISCDYMVPTFLLLPPNFFHTSNQKQTYSPFTGLKEACALHKKKITCALHYSQHPIAYILKMLMAVPMRKDRRRSVRAGDSAS